MNYDQRDNMNAASRKTLAEVLKLGEAQKLFTVTSKRTGEPDDDNDTDAHGVQYARDRDR
jgi:hypothetical protein